VDPGERNGINDQKPSAFVLSAGEKARISWALLDPEDAGFVGSGELHGQVIRYEWKQARQAGVGGAVNLLWERTETVEEEWSTPFTPSDRNQEEGLIRGVHIFTPAQSGPYEIRLRSADSRGRAVLTRLQFYASGSGWVRWGSADSDRITLTPDSASYAPGETAKILVQSPLPRGSYLLTLEREGIFSESIITLDGSARTIEIPLSESHIPIVYAALSSYTVRGGPPENSYFEPDLDKPQGIFGLCALHVEEESRHYQVEIEDPQGVYSPGERVELHLRLTQRGQPVAGAEMSFLAVDRGVVDLIDYHVPDPLSFFYNPQNFPLAVRGADSRSLLIDPVTYSVRDLQGGDAETDSKLEMRKDFRPTAVFEPFLVTGADGRVTVSFTLPDSLTTYRCTAVAVGLDAFGLEEQDLRVSAPLTAVAALPLKLRWRDTSTVSLILSNLEKTPVEAEVKLDIETLRNVLETPTDPPSGPVLEVEGPETRRILIPPGESLEAAFSVAAVGAGEAQLAFTLRSPRVNERILKTLAVDRPVVYETVSTIGSLTAVQGAAEEAVAEEGIILPDFVPEGTGSLEVSLSASRLASLKEAVGYLLDYPYGCWEQRTARLLPLIAFGDILIPLGLDSAVLRDPEGISAVISREIAALARDQLGDGSIPDWSGGQGGDYYVTIRALHIAALAMRKGIAIPSSLNIQKALRYLADSPAVRLLRAGYHPDVFTSGYALWVRAMHGENVDAELTSYLQMGDSLGISGWGFGGLAALELKRTDLARSTFDRLRRFIRPGTRTLDLSDTYEALSFWGGETDRYALALMLYHAVSPHDDMVTRLANALIERQRKGRWTHTSSNFWALLAFASLADSEALDHLSIRAQVRVDTQPILDAPLAAPTLSYSQRFALSESPLAGFRRETLLPLQISAEGQGRLYYTAALRYGIPSELSEARDEGLGVYTEILDSEGDPILDGRLVPGKTYTRRITLSTPRPRTYIALRAPVPSGALIIDSTLLISSTLPEAGGTEGNSRRGDIQTMVMDDEVRYFWDYLPQGREVVEFRFRAVMPGIYPTPPVQAEGMYEPEVFGRSSGELFWTH
jgi:uncharacterized protein YfaS (alpha-2-macroglobulin family)